MAQERLKGQETVVRFLQAKSIVGELTDIQSFEVEFQMEDISEGYLGETTDRKDDVFRGCRGRMTLHIEDKKFFTMLNDVINRARRKVDLFTIDVMTTLGFPEGGDLKFLFQDLRFGPMPLSFPDRVSYVSIDLEWQTSEYVQIS